MGAGRGCARPHGSPERRCPNQPHPSRAPGHGESSKRQDSQPRVGGWLPTGWPRDGRVLRDQGVRPLLFERPRAGTQGQWCNRYGLESGRDRKSTRLNSSHVRISYAVFCLKKKKKKKKNFTHKKKTKKKKNKKTKKKQM